MATQEDPAAAAPETAAGPPKTPENAAAGTGGSSAWVSVALLAAGLLAWLWVLRLASREGRGMLVSVRWGALRDGGHGDGPGASRGVQANQIGMVLVLCGMAAWLAQALGASIALGLSGLPLAAGSLRAGVVGQAGAYAGSLLVLGGVLLVLPGAARMVGLAGFDRGVARECWETLRRAAAWMIVAGPAVYLIGAASLSAARVVARLSGGDEPGQVAHQTLAKLTEPGAASSVWWWLTVVGVVVGAPLVEEFIYRGFLQTGVLKMTRSAPAAIGITSGVFAVAHVGAVPWHAVFTLFCLSVAFGLALERTGRLWVCVLMHAAFNAANVGLSMV